MCCLLQQDRHSTKQTDLPIFFVERINQTNHNNYERGGDLLHSQATNERMPNLQSPEPPAPESSQQNVLSGDFIDFIGENFTENQEQRRPCKRVSYLDEKIMKLFLHWFLDHNSRSSGPGRNFFSNLLMKFRIKSIMDASVSQPQRQDPNQNHNHHQENSASRILYSAEFNLQDQDHQIGTWKLVNKNSHQIETILFKNKLFNLLIMICHLVIVLRIALDQDVLPSFDDLLSFSRDSIKDIPMDTVNHEKESTDATGCKNSNYLSYKLILAVSLLDLFNELYRLHWSKNIHRSSSGEIYLNNKGRGRSWILSLVYLLSNPKQIFQCATCVAFMLLGLHSINPLPIILGSCNQLLLSGYNCCRAFKFTEIAIQPEDQVSLIRSIGHHDWVIDFQESTGWSLDRLEKFLIISQILYVKLIVSTMLLHVDLNAAIWSRGNKFNNYTIFAFLTAAFLTLHSHYDKYYSRYLFARGISIK